MMTICKICEVKPKYANTNFCYSCYREREKRKKLEKEQKKLERKVQSKGYQESLRKKLHKKAWGLMSQWVRRKDANLDGFVECYTCNEIKHYKEMNAGHFHHDRLDFDERNIKPQCVTCNKYYSGRLNIYATNLLQEYGSKWFMKLDQDAKAYNKYTPERLKEIIIDLQNKISKL